jgi:hypothetical protein
MGVISIPTVCRRINVPKTKTAALAKLEINDVETPSVLQRNKCTKPAVNLAKTKVTEYSKTIVRIFWRT